MTYCASDLAIEHQPAGKMEWKTFTDTILREQNSRRRRRGKTGADGHPLSTPALLQTIVSQLCSPFPEPVRRWAEMNPNLPLPPIGPPIEGGNESRGELSGAFSVGHHRDSSRIGNEPVVTLNPWGDAMASEVQRCAAAAGLLASRSKKVLPPGETSLVASQTLTRRNFAQSHPSTLKSGTGRNIDERENTDDIFGK